MKIWKMWTSKGGGAGLSRIAGSGYRAMFGRRETRRRKEVNNKSPFPNTGKGPPIKNRTIRNTKRLSPDPFPVARRSNRNRQSGSSPGFGSSRPGSFPCSRTVVPVGALTFTVAGPRRIVGTTSSQFLAPAFLLSLSTPDPNNMNYLNYKFILCAYCN